FGTDGSSPWAVHQELEDMVRAGMPAADVLAAATGGAAALLQRTDIGVIESGRSADFLVLDGDPTADITATRRIDSVYLRGTAVDREALATRLKGAAAQ
ncbi:MAG: amidohydrolase family protein, partial [Gemmatimonadetes bacterium]|nr:amidohydrolase family protein [Gemmatimonadota bacterium]